MEMSCEERSPRERIEFGWFGLRVRVSSADPGVARLVRRRWGTLPAADATAPVREYRVGSETGGWVFRGPAGERPLDAAQPAIHAYNLLITDLLAQVGEHFVFHAMAVARDDRALIISGPSTFGKTTLGIEMCGRGFGLLADDFAVTARSTGKVHPFTRSLNLRPGSRRALNHEQLERALDARFDVIDDEWVVDPVRWLGPPPQPASIAMVVILRPHEDGTDLRRFPRCQVVTLRGEESRLVELRDLPGIREVAIDPDRPFVAGVTVDDSHALIGWLDRNERFLVSAVKFVSAPPNFSGEPSLEPIGTFQAAIELTQELLNRHPGSRLAEEYAGRESQQVADVARMLHGANCFALCPGRLETTLDRLEATFAGVTA